MRELLDQMDNLHDLLERRIYTIEKFVQRQTFVNDKLKDVQSQIEQIKMSIQLEESRERNKTQLIPRIQTTLAEYRQIDDIAKKNRLLKSVLEKVTYYKQPSTKHKSPFTVQLYLRF